MPKGGTNPKAESARARKEDKKEQEKAKLAKAKEDAEWEDNDKSVKKKQERADEKLKKQQEAAQRKAENRALAAQDEESLVDPKKTPQKVTRASISELQEKQRKEEEKKAKPGKISRPEILTENPNRVEMDGEEARTVDEAIVVLTPQASSDAFDKKAKAAFLAFEEERLPVLKEENPSMRLSQIQNLLKKEWMRSPRNPFNHK